MTPFHTLRRRFALIALVLIASPLVATHDCAANGWSPVIIATGQYRQQIESTPITQRPNRPLHVYGNAVRLRNERATQPASRRIPTPGVVRILTGL